MNENLNIEVYKLLYRHRKSILIFTFSMALAAVIFTMPLFITPLYKSEAIIAPSGTNSTKIFIEHDPKFGAEREIDEQTQILQSASCRDSMIRRFHLVERYKIDTSKANGVYDLYEEYDKSIYVDRTRYGSISIRVFDINADTAAAMANALVSIADKVKNSIIKKNILQVFHSIEKDFFEKGKTLDLQAAEVNGTMNRMMVSGSLIRAKVPVEQIKEQVDLKSAIQQLQYAGEKLNQLGMLEAYDRSLQQYLELKTNYQQAVAYVNSDVPPSYIISPAEPINKKAYPPRVWIVLLVTVTSFFLACATGVAANQISVLYQRIRT
jgi:uncharacterized protein involved in exopolysaccharide biosynthesis